MDKNGDFRAKQRSKNGGQKSREYKERPRHFANVDEGVKVRLDEKARNRKSSRLSEFDKSRDLSESAPGPSNANLEKNSKRARLEMWKAERESKKAASAPKKKPFVVGVVPMKLRYEPPPANIKAVMPSTSGTIPRSHSSQSSICNTKRGVSKSTSKPFVPETSKMTTRNKKKLTSTETSGPSLPNQQDHDSKNETDSETKGSNITSNKEKGISSTRILRPRNHTSNNIPAVPKNLTKNSQSSLTKKTEAPKKKSHRCRSGNDNVVNLLDPKVSSENNIAKNSTSSKESTEIIPSSSNAEANVKSMELIPEYPKVSPPIDLLVAKVANNGPWVTLTRENINNIEEMKQKMRKDMLLDGAGDMETVHHLRRQMNSEIDRITQLCNTWEKIFEENQLPESVLEVMLAATGHARLLMSSKLKQFANLLEQCACPKPGERRISPTDLHGFWDVVYLQIKNVHIRFEKLEELKSRNWVEEKPVQKKKKIAPAPAKGTTRPAVVSSRIRDIIAAARLANKRRPSAGDTQSPVAPPSSATSSTPSLRKSVLFKEANEAAASEATPQLIQINFNATPGRSILK